MSVRPFVEMNAICRPSGENTGPLIHAFAIDDRARVAALHGDRVHARLVRRRESAARRGGVGDLAAVRRPREAVDIVHRRRQRHRSLGRIKSLHHQPGRTIGRVGADDERSVLPLPFFVGGHRIASEEGEAFAVGRPFVREHALWRGGQALRCAAGNRDCEHLWPGSREAEDRDHRPVRRPAQLRPWHRHVENADGVAEPRGLPARGRDNEQRRFVFVFGKGRRRHHVRHAFAVRRDAHVEDGPQPHQIVNRHRPRGSGGRGS